MALVVETGTGLDVDAEAYVSVADYLAYLIKMNYTALAEDDDRTEAAIRRATQYIDGKYLRRFRGTQAVEGQPLQWPREDVWIGITELPADELPRNLIQATCELAFLVENGIDLMPTLERGGALRAKTETVGPITERNAWASSASPEDVYLAAEFLLRPLLKRGGLIRELVRT
jgi:hypothetical protein